MSERRRSPPRPAPRRRAARGVGLRSSARRHEARPRPPGRRPAHLRGPADGAAADGHAGGALERSLDIMRDRVDAFGVAEPELLLRGENQIEVNLPGENAERAAAAGRLDGPAVLLRLGSQHPRRGLPDGPGRERQRQAAGHRLLRRGQARVRCDPQADGNNNAADGRASTRSTRSRSSRSTTAAVRVAQGRARGPERRAARRTPRSSRSRRASSSCATRSRAPTLRDPDRTGG